MNLGAADTSVRAPSGVTEQVQLNSISAISRMSGQAAAARAVSRS